MIVFLLQVENVKGNDPQWTYTTGSNIRITDISSQGEYIVAANEDHVYLLDRAFTNNESLWNYTTNSRVYSASISSNGEYIVAGCMNKNVYLFDKNFTNQTPLWTYTLDWLVTKVDISADGEHIVALSKDYIYIFNNNDSTPNWTAKIYPSSVAISNDGKYIVVGTRDNEVYLFLWNNSTPLWSYTIADNNNIVNSITLSDQGEYFFAGSELVGSGEQQSLHLFDREFTNNRTLWNYTGSTGDVVAISANGDHLTAINNQYLYLWNKDSNTTRWTFDSSGTTLLSLSMSGDGGYVVTSDWDGRIFGFQTDNSTPFWNFQSDNGASINTIAISTDGGYVVAGDNDNNVYFFINQDTEPPQNEPPNAIIELLDKEVVALGDIVILQGNGSDTDGQVVGYRWDSDIDGTLGSQANLDLDTTSMTLGIHNITLIVQDDDGAWTEPTNATLRIHQRPIASIDIIEPNPARIGQSITFTGSGIDDGEIISYEWQFDGVVANRNATFSLNDLTVGVYNISFRVQDNDGAWSNSVEESLSVHRAENEPPTAHINSIDPITALEGQLVTFNGSGLDSDGSIIDYLWELSMIMGDPVEIGNTSEVTWQAKVGYFQVSLKVQDSDGIWSEANLTIFEVDNIKPIAYIESIQPLPAFTGQSITFHGGGWDTLGTIQAYKWYLDGKEESDQSFFTKDALEEGEHTVGLKVQDDEGGWSILREETFHVLQLGIESPRDMGLAPINEPIWNTTLELYSPNFDMSADGEYIVISGYQYKETNYLSNTIFLFGASLGPAPIWKEQFTRENFYRLDISGDGNYILAGWQNFRSKMEAEWMRDDHDELYTSYSGGNGVAFFERSNLAEPLWRSSISFNPSTSVLSHYGDWVFALKPPGSMKYNDEWLIDPQLIAIRSSSNEPTWLASSPDFDNALYYNFRRMAASRSGGKLAASSNVGLHFYDTDTATTLWNRDLGGQPQFVDISSGGDLIAGTNATGTVFLFDADGNLTYEFKNDGLREMLLSGDGSRIVSSHYEEGKYVIRVDQVKYEFQPTFWEFESGFEPIYAIDISYDGTLIAVGTSTEIYLLESGKDTPLWRFPVGGDYKIKQIQISEDGKYIATMDHDGNLFYFSKDLRTEPRESDDSPAFSTLNILTLLVLVAAWHGRCSTTRSSN